MKDKTKRTWLIVVGALVCVALVVAIAGRFGTPTVTDPQLTNDTPNDSAPVVDINTPDKPEVVVQIDTGGAKDYKDPAAGADSSGTEQAIQADPVKPDAPENPTPVEENHDGTDVPEAERNTETPPTYTPERPRLSRNLSRRAEVLTKTERYIYQASATLKAAVRVLQSKMSQFMKMEIK